MMNGTIVVPLDGSALAENALPLGSSLARQMHSTLHLLQVIPPLQPIYWGYGGAIAPPEQLTLLQGDAESYLQALAEQLLEQAVTVTHEVAVGPVGESIVRVADEQDATAIVMSTHGCGGLARWALGSVAGRVLHLTERPLVMLPPQQERPLSPCFPKAALKRILVPLDGSPEAEQILPHVMMLATSFGAEIILMRALPGTPIVIPGLEMVMVQDDWQATVREQARFYLQQIQKRLEGEGFQVRAVLGMLPAAEAILESAAATGADLIAMTSHAREGMSRLLLGSVTDRVVRAGQHPVLVTRLVSRTPREVETEPPFMYEVDGR